MHLNQKFRTLMEATDIATNNMDANLAVNTLMQLQNKSLHLENNLVYQPEDIPMLPISVAENNFVGIEGDIVALVANRSGLTEEAVIDKVYDYLCNLKEEGTELIEGCDTFSKDKLAIIVKEFSPETLYKEIVSEATSECGHSRLDDINGYINSINKAQENGYTVIFSK